MKNLKDGFLLINKESGCTSHDVVYKTRKLISRKSGHTGTLDPFACGLLIVALGKATKYVEYIFNESKEYIFDISWGVSTDSYDLTGKTTGNSDKVPTRKDIEDKVKYLKHVEEQTPPIFSAVKINGKRSYQYAREGKEIKLSPRKIYIDNFELLESSGNTSKFKVECSKGTYIRSLANDLSKLLGCLGHVSYLQRTKIGNFYLENSIAIGDLNDKESFKKSFLSIDEALQSLSSFTVNLDTFNKLKNGNKLTIKNLPFTKEETIKLKFSNSFFAIATYSNNIIKPKKVIC